MYRINRQVATITSSAQRKPTTPQHALHCPMASGNAKTDHTDNGIYNEIKQIIVKFEYIIVIIVLNGLSRKCSNTCIYN